MPLSFRHPRRPPLEHAAREARLGVPLALVATTYACDQGAILAAAGLTFEAHLHRVKVRADLAFASPRPLSTPELDEAVAQRVER